MFPPLFLTRNVTDLASIGVRTRVGHGQDTGSGVLELEVLIRKLLAVYGLTTSNTQDVVNAVQGTSGMM